MKTITVVGANGTMGCNIAAIFASFGDAQVYLMCRKMDDSVLAIEKAVESVKCDGIRKKLIAVDYSYMQRCVGESELIFESVAENLEIKRTVLGEIAKHLKSGQVCCTGTSGFSVTTLAEVFKGDLRGGFFGMHMFNPPYNMSLCEMIPTKYTNREVFENVKLYAREVLHRKVVEVEDKPSFLGNRIGFQFINEAIQYAERYKEKGGIDYIDSILGGFTGRSMPPIMTADFVGLDIHKSIVDYLYSNTNDYANTTFILPQFANNLISAGKLGRKVNEGFYKRVTTESGEKKQCVYDISLSEYREKRTYEFEFANKMKEYISVGEYLKAFAVLEAGREEEAEICLEFLLKYIVYSIATSSQVSASIHAADDVMATGFNWCPPFGMIEALSGVEKVKKLVKERFAPLLQETIDIEKIMGRVAPSRYDYRKFIKGN